MEVVTSISNYDMSMCANHLAKPSGCESAAQGTPTYERISQPIFAMYIVSILYSPKMQQGSRMPWNKTASSQFSRLKILLTRSSATGQVFTCQSPKNAAQALISGHEAFQANPCSDTNSYREQTIPHKQKTKKQRISALYYDAR